MHQVITTRPKAALRFWLACLLASALLGIPSSQAAAGVTITVTTGLDDDGLTCDSNSCSLRGAINKANANGQTFNTIVFAQTAGTVFVTNGSLPAITNPGLSINGSYNNTFPRIYGANGGTFFINADDVNIVFLTIVNTTNGPDIQISGGRNIAIGNNYLGTVAGAPNCAYVSPNQGTNGVRVMPNNAGNAATPVAYIYGNIIGCHQYEGIFAGGATVKIGHNRSDNVVRNLIGLADDGMHAAGNGYAGIAVMDWIYDASDNLIEGNAISGNGHEGIYVLGASDTQITSNIIGLSANAFQSTSAVPVPNGLAGIALFAASNTWIGGGDGSTHNLIAGNTREGIYIKDGGNSSIDPWNAIGAPLAELTCAPGWGNGLAGILLDGSAADWTIFPAVVGCNGAAGVATTGNAIFGRNRIVPFRVGLNGGLPIDRGDDGVTPAKYPAITSVSSNGPNVTIAGAACANCYVYIYAARGNPAAAGGGGWLIRDATADSAGQWSLTVSSSSIAPRVPALVPSSFSAHVYDPTLNIEGTFEMSQRPQVFLPLILR